MLSSPVGANSSMSSLGGGNERVLILKELERDIKANYKKKEEDILRAAKKEAVELRKKYREAKKRHRQELSDIYTSLLSTTSAHRDNITLTTAEIHQISKLMQDTVQTFELLMRNTAAEEGDEWDGTRDGHPMIRKLQLLMDQEAAALAPAPAPALVPASTRASAPTGALKKAKKGRKTDETLIEDGPH